ncbi:MAG: hypothetical protein RL220_110 [Bacteroidota bacterium]|jgi:UDP-N-acetylmuramoyl-tripeptide--D-alanyl-D-alanine ligase
MSRILETFLKTHSVSTDSRQIAEGTIYFGLKGERFDGSDFAADALSKGASLAIVGKPIGISDERIIQVEDTLQALQELALAYRRTLKIPFLAITGSNGKTTTKELVRDVLATRYHRVHATKGNLNNHIGVPLTLLSMPSETDFAVIEMGANHQREIADLCSIAEPDMGLITNIGKAHLEGFGGVEGVFKGKKELFDYVGSKGGLIFVNRDQENLIRAAEGVQQIQFGLVCDQFTIEVLSSEPYLELRVQVPGHGAWECRTKMTGAYNAANIASALSVGLYHQVDAGDAIAAIERYVPDNHRSQVIQTAKNTVFMDAYNANPSSLSHALSNLAAQKTSTFFIIGDMRELGEESLNEHANILKHATDLGLKGIAIGEHFYQAGLDMSMTVFSDKPAAIEWLEAHPPHDKTILLKGSRGMKLEELLPFL